MNKYNKKFRSTVYKYCKELSLLPLTADSKRPAIKFKDYNNTIIPKSHFPAEWGNIAIMCGSVNHIIVIDADNKKAVKLCNKYLPKTITQITNRGKHYIFEYKGKATKLKNWTGLFGLKIDVRTNNGYIKVHDLTLLTKLTKEAPATLPSKFIKAVLKDRRIKPTHSSGANLSAKPSSNFSKRDTISALFAINPNCGYEDWRMIATSVKLLLPGEGGELFWLWSDMSDGKVMNESERGNWWNQIDAELGNRSAFFYRAKENGWKGPNN